MAGIWGRGDFCSSLLLLFLSCISSPPDCFSGMGARQLGCRFYSIWHLPRGFLNLMHSGLYFSRGHVFLCLLGLSQLLWPAIIFCPKELCRCWAQVAHGQVFPNTPRIYTNIYEVHFWFGFATTPLRRACPTPLAFLVFFFFSLCTGIQVQELICVAVVSSWPYSLCSNWSRMQGIWDLALPLQLRGS